MSADSTLLILGTVFAYAIRVDGVTAAEHDTFSQFVSNRYGPQDARVIQDYRQSGFDFQTPTSGNDGYYGLSLIRVGEYAEFTLMLYSGQTNTSWIGMYLLFDSYSL